VPGLRTKSGSHTPVGSAADPIGQCPSLLSASKPIACDLLILSASGFSQKRIDLIIARRKWPATEAPAPSFTKDALTQAETLVSALHRSIKCSTHKLQTTFSNPFRQRIRSRRTEDGNPRWLLRSRDQILPLWAVCRLVRGEIRSILGSHGSRALA
jgi:hypothetical protein